jgi:hypothetical protein
MAQASSSSGIDLRLVRVLARMARCLLEAERLPTGPEGIRGQGERPSQSPEGSVAESQETGAHGRERSPE